MGDGGRRDAWASEPEIKDLGPCAGPPLQRASEARGGVGRGGHCRQWDVCCNFRCNTVPGFLGCVFWGLGQGGLSSATPAVRSCNPNPNRHPRNHPTCTGRGNFSGTAASQKSKRGLESWRVGDAGSVRTGGCCVVQSHQSGKDRPGQTQGALPVGGRVAGWLAGCQVTGVQDAG